MSMYEENNMLLQAILNEQRAIRNEVTDLSQTVVSKSDMSDYRSEMKIHFEEIKKDAVKQSDLLSLLQIAEAANTNFRKGITNGVRYVGGAIFVAFLGVASALVPALFSHSTNNTSVTVVSNPTATPFKSLKIHLPSNSESQ